MKNDKNLFSFGWKENCFLLFLILILFEWVEHLLFIIIVIRAKIAKKIIWL